MSAFKSTGSMSFKGLNISALLGPFNFPLPSVSPNCSINNLFCWSVKSFKDSKNSEASLIILPVPSAIKATFSLVNETTFCSKDPPLVAIFLVSLFKLSVNNLMIACSLNPCALKFKNCCRAVSLSSAPKLTFAPLFSARIASISFFGKSSASLVKFSFCTSDKSSKVKAAFFAASVNLAIAKAFASVFPV